MAERRCASDEQPVLRPRSELRVTWSQIRDTSGSVKVERRQEEEGGGAVAGAGMWSVGLSLPSMQVSPHGASISEVRAATAQQGPIGRSWFFGDRDSSNRLRDLENRTTVGSMRRPIECLAQVPGLRCAGVQLRQCFERFLDASTFSSWTRAHRLGQAAVTARDPLSGSCCRRTSTTP